MHCSAKSFDTSWRGHGTSCDTDQQQRRNICKHPPAVSCAEWTQKQYLLRTLVIHRRVSELFRWDSNKDKKNAFCRPHHHYHCRLWTMNDTPAVVVSDSLVVAADGCSMRRCNSKSRFIFISSSSSRKVDLLVVTVAVGVVTRVVPVVSILLVV